MNSSLRRIERYDIIASLVERRLARRGNIRSCGRLFASLPTASVVPRRRLRRSRHVLDVVGMAERGGGCGGGGGGRESEESVLVSAARSGTGARYWRGGILPKAASSCSHYYLSRLHEVSPAAFLGTVSRHRPGALSLRVDVVAPQTRWQIQ